MTPVSTSLDSLQGFIRQFGVADSGDPLAILRSLGIQINEAMAGAVETQKTDLEARLAALKTKGELLDRLAAGEPLGDFIVWPVDEANALRAALATPTSDPLSPFETFVRYQREVIAAGGGSTTTDQGTTIASQADWLSDYTRSVNEFGQVVWTKVGAGGGTLGETIVFTELETLAGAPAPRVNAAQGELVLEMSQLVLGVAAETQKLRFTLKEWLSDVRIDERWMQFGRRTEARRSDAQLDTQRQELLALLERLDELGHESVEMPPPWVAESHARRAAPASTNGEHAEAREAYPREEPRPTRVGPRG
ncbi:MAG: hypothetical protein GTN86_12615 [Xanthomonadales bacterium]|uniref:hypothetical protein n=1 Tax=Hydrogenophaga sp. TaxID=1904254 RepID=UPI00169A5CA0|nr:hypothetical protein [Hydrogenophaga sp.]NIQ36735.1 hypothetical protein [Xanthomonadales bacterium]NIM42003.1 hypothetical protein [Hydrogenophaga sp.]NIN27306.1 hypothetical protein [Hydrogenophaga sp.]NIN32007.1 hypothetical protein [Hydrogenophaga sp.]NIN56159.1 hypothetical protein [Hydrogenophaga sp.]